MGAFICSSLSALADLLKSDGSQLPESHFLSSGLVLVKSGKVHMEMKKFVCSRIFEYSVQSSCAISGFIQILVRLIYSMIHLKSLTLFS